MHIKWHLCDVNGRPYPFATLGMRGNFDIIFLGISVARKLKTYRKSSNKPPPPPIFRGRRLISPPPPLPLNIIIIHDCQESIATVKIRLDWSRMVYSPTWSSDLFLILVCISSKFLYFSFSTLPSSLWRTDTIFFAKLNKPSPLSHKPHVFIKLSPSQMSCPEELKGNLENRLCTNSEVTTGHEKRRKVFWWISSWCFLFQHLFLCTY